tara:strand:+ start:4052 stop:4297 length:246 start_codon:yes stop_codon:yes gene_type:complete
MELNDKNLESFLLKAEADPAVMEIMKGIMYWCQAASEAGISLQEIASVGTVGYQLAQDESLKAFFEYVVKMNSMGIKPVEH